MKALLGAFNQEKALVGAFSVIVQFHRLIVYSNIQHRTAFFLPLLSRMKAMKSLISLEEFKGLSEEDMVKEVEKVLPLLSPLCQVRIPFFCSEDLKHHDTHCAGVQ